MNNYSLLNSYLEFFIVNDIKLNESQIQKLKENFLSDSKNKIVNIFKLKEEWKQEANTFIEHKWIYRYITDTQKKTLEKYYNQLTDENVSYSDYKKAFRYITQFMGLPNKGVILEWVEFQDNKDKTNMEYDSKYQYQIAVRYSKGLKEVHIPDGVKLTHISPVDNIKQLEPAFRSKTKGKFFYPSKRCFFTVGKPIDPFKAGLDNKTQGKKIKSHKYQAKEKYKTAYIDPTYTKFSDGSIYIETDNPIPVEKVN